MGEECVVLGLEPERETFLSVHLALPCRHSGSTLIISSEASRSKGEGLLDHVPLRNGAEKHLGRTNITSRVYTACLTTDVVGA